jgi:hypothetical protein
MTKVSYFRSRYLPRALHFSTLAFAFLALCALAIATVSFGTFLGCVGFGLTFARDAFLLPSSLSLLLLCTTLSAALGAVFAALSICCSRACASL